MNRTVTLFKWEKVRGTNNGEREKIEAGKGKFLAFGFQAGIIQEYPPGAGSTHTNMQPTVLIETPDGYVKNLPLDCIRFDDNEEAIANANKFNKSEPLITPDPMKVGNF